MSSLASCIKKAGTALTPEDATEIRRIHDDLVAAGESNPAQRAIDEFLGSLSTERDTLVSRIEERGGAVSTGLQYARQQTPKDIASKISAVSILEGTETLKIPDAKVTKAGKLRATALQLARVLEARAKRINNGRDLSSRTARSKEIISETLAQETIAAINRTGHAGDWYSTVLANAVSIVSELHPELKTDVNARNIFLLGLAITSNGMDVDTNSRLAEEVYAYYKKNGVFPARGEGPQGSSQATGFKLANLLISKWGVTDFVKFLNTEFTVGELKTLGFDVSGELVDFKTHGSVVFGPKVGGGFFQNLMGNFSPLTMDRWFMRTWGRMTGTLLPPKDLNEAQVSRLVAAILANRKKVEAAGFDVEQAINNDFALLEVAAHFNKVYAKSKSAFSNTYGDKTELNKASKNLHLGATAPVIAPRNGEERAWIREVGEAALVKLRERGFNINAASMQALVWYPEKDLYLQHGVGNAKSKPTDYEQEFEKLALSRGISQSRIDAARTGDSNERPADATRRDAGSEPSVEESAAPAFTAKERKGLVQRESTQRIREQLPRSYRRAVAKRVRPVLEGVAIRQHYKPEIKTRNAYKRVNLAAPDFVELEASEGAAELFIAKITQARKNQAGVGAAVYIYTAPEYESMRLFLTPDGTAGFALNGDDIISVFKDPEADLPGVVQSIIGLAVSEGGRKLDAFDTILPTFYSLQGFRAVARVPWNENEKPAGWKKSEFSEWNDGEPDVVFMVYDKNHKGFYTGAYEGDYVETYTEAVRVQTEAVNSLAERNKPTLRYRIEEEAETIINQNPESPLSRMHKLGATVEDQANLGDGTLTVAKIREAIADKGILAVLGAIPRRNIRDFIPENLAPSLHRYIRIANRMSGRRNELIEPAEAIARRWSNWTRKNKRMSGQLSDVMHASTLAGVDPSEDFKPLKKAENMNDEDRKTNAMRLEQHIMLKEHYGRLDETAQGLFNEVRDFYSDQRDSVHEALNNRIDESAAEGRSKRVLQDLLRQKFEAGRVTGPYFPLARFGDIWASVKDNDGEVVSFARFESREEMREWLASFREMGYTDANFDKGQKNDTDAKTMASVDPEFVKRIQDLVGNDSNLQDEIWQMYLATLPEMSMRKRFMHRKGRLGFTANALRAFANVTFHGAHQQAKLEYVHQLEDNMRSMLDEVREIERTEDGSLFNWAMPVYNEMMHRHQAAMNPKAGTLAVGLTGLGFLWYLGVTPAAAAVNLSQTPLVAFPTLAARFNTLGAAKELMSAAKLYAGAWRGPLEARLRGAEYEAFVEARKIGLFEKTQAHDLAGVSELGSTHYGGRTHMTMKIGSMLFHKAEQMNREVTFLAGYRLAIRDGQTQEDAIITAEDLTWDSHFDYNTENRPRWMQGDLLRVLTLFKQYSLNMTYRINRDIYSSFAGESAEVKREARVRLTGMLSMAAIMGGYSGLPAIIIKPIEFVADTLFGDDDDEIRAEDALRIYLAEMTSPKMAEAIMKGPVDALTGLTLSNRVSLNNLWMRDPSPYDQDKPWIDRFIMDVAMGPVIGQARSTMEGIGDIGEGHTQRGIERMMPKVVRDIMRAHRLNAEGALTLHTPQDVLVPREDMTPADIFWQAFGFTPARLTMQYEQNNAIRRAEKHIQDERARAMDMYQLALFNDDKRTMAEAMQRVSEFNVKYPHVAIGGSSLMRGTMNRLDRSARSQGGVALQNNMMWLYDRLGFTPPRNTSEEE